MDNCTCYEDHVTYCDDQRAGNCDCPDGEDCTCEEPDYKGTYPGCMCEDTFEHTCLDYADLDCNSDYCDCSCHFNDDDSDGGFELVSRILSGTEGLDEIRTVCKLLNRAGDYGVKSDCGLHVHIYAGDMTLKQLKQVVLLWIKHEIQIGHLVDSDRLDNHYCTPLVRYLNYDCNDYDARVLSMVARIKRASTIAELVNDISRYSRYYSLNLNAYKQYKTIEFRMHEGTINSNEIVAWITFLQKLVDRACEMHHVTVTPIKAESKFISRQTNKLTAIDTLRSIKLTGDTLVHFATKLGYTGMCNNGDRQLSLTM